MQSDKKKQTQKREFARDFFNLIPLGMSIKSLKEFLRKNVSLDEKFKLHEGVYANAAINAAYHGQYAPLLYMIRIGRAVKSMEDSQGKTLFDYLNDPIVADDVDLDSSDAERKKVLKALDEDRLIGKPVVKKTEEDRRLFELDFFHLTALGMGKRTFRLYLDQGVYKNEVFELPNGIEATAIMNAAYHGNYKLVERLAKDSSTIEHAIDNDGKTLLMYLSDPEICCGVDADFNYTARLSALRFILKTHKSILDVNQKDESDYNALFYAIASELWREDEAKWKFGIIKELLKNKATLDVSGMLDALDDADKEKAQRFFNKANIRIVESEPSSVPQPA